MGYNAYVRSTRAKDTISDRVQAMLARSSEPLRPADIAERLGAARNSVSAALRRLCDRGVVKAEGSTYTRSYRLARENDDARA